MYYVAHDPKTKQAQVFANIIPTDWIKLLETASRFVAETFLKDFLQNQNTSEEVRTSFITVYEFMQSTLYKLNDLGEQIAQLPLDETLKLSHAIEVVKRALKM